MSTSHRRAVQPRIYALVVLLGIMAAGPSSPQARGRDLGQVPLDGVTEAVFEGPRQGPSDTPARNVELAVTFRHEGGDALVVHGFRDGDGKGGARGNVYRVRFCPTRTGEWRLVHTRSNRTELEGRREGDSIRCVPSSHPGLWIPDGRTYRRMKSMQDQEGSS